MGNGVDSKDAGEQAVVNPLRVLFVDDEAPIREVMRIELPRMGHEVTVCEDGETALEVLAEHHFDAAIVDLKMPGISGWEVTDHIKQVSPETFVIIHTGHGDMHQAIEAVRHRANDFLNKPCKLVDIQRALARAAEWRQQSRKTQALETRLKAIEGSTELVGQTPAMQQVATLIERVAPTDSSVLVLGETGTGKELVARRVHELSARSEMPFVPVNCGALPEHLVESEFFGHRKGAFTGADRSRTGLFEVAHGGTLFLDELGELDKPMQVKLLRFLESGEIRRVGENEPIHVDVRIVCATNGDLAEMVADGGFREDLYFRVNTFEIPLPPLRDRKPDLPLLAAALLTRARKRPVDDDEELSAEVLAGLADHDWPGNVRELANAIEHAVIMAGDRPVSVEHLPQQLATSRPGIISTFVMPSGAMTLREVERQVLLGVLDKHGGDKRMAAEELGIALKTMYNKLNQYNASAVGESSEIVSTD
ncbi:MAG: sigma-54 dependent transcriptional regulator [Planctomycetales bacterium]|nr:sigma-54 dependent transcriptional regulator [Planctomycetales bacterium]